MDTTSIGGRVWSVREKFGLSRKDFADRIGSTSDEIGNVEYNRLKRPELKEPLFRAISSEFGVSLDWIKTGEGDMFGASKQDEITMAFGELAARKDPVIDGFIQFLRSRTPDELQFLAKQLRECVDQMERFDPNKEK